MLSCFRQLNLRDDRGSTLEELHHVFRDGPGVVSLRGPGPFTLDPDARAGKYVDPFNVAILAWIGHDGDEPGGGTHIRRARTTPASEKPPAPIPQKYQVTRNHTPPHNPKAPACFVIDFYKTEDTFERR